MTSEGSQANLATPTPVRKPDVLFIGKRLEPSADITGQDVTSSFTPHGERNTPSRDLMQTLGLNQKTPGAVGNSQEKQNKTTAQNNITSVVGKN